MRQSKKRAENNKGHLIFVGPRNRSDWNYGVMNRHVDSKRSVRFEE